MVAAAGGDVEFVKWETGTGSMSNPPAGDDPVADFIREYRAEHTDEPVGTALGAEQRSVATAVREPALPDARTVARAAVGAVNRRDHGQALLALQRLLRDRDSTMAAIEVLTGILLSGLPREALKSGCRIPVEFAVVPGDDQCPKAVAMASDLLTGVAMEDQALVGPALLALADGHGLDVLLVLVRAAAARIEFFVGLDGDTVDAYYEIVRG
jgi:hypothetical protein